MKISTRGQYGVRAMIELSRAFGAGPVSIKAIAEQQGLSHSYLEQLLAPLRRAGLVRSVRGPEGGYYLASAPEAITVGDVLRVLEGPLAPVECVEDGEGGLCAQEAGCPARRVWMMIRNAVTDVVDSVTLQDLMSDEPFVDERREHVGGAMG